MHSEDDLVQHDPDAEADDFFNGAASSSNGYHPPSNAYSPYYRTTDSITTHSTRAPSPPPSAPILDHSHLRPGNQASLLSHDAKTSFTKLQPCSSASQTEVTQQASTSLQIATLTASAPARTSKTLIAHTLFSCLPRNTIIRMPPTALARAARMGGGADGKAQRLCSFIERRLLPYIPVRCTVWV